MSKYMVKRAIIMAAGVGKRMQTLTFKTPKPLIDVNGIRMIESIIDALLANGIEDINIVTGYLADSFECIKSKYPIIRFVNNPDYNKYNNISLLYYARNLLDTDVIISDADQLIRNKDVLSPYFDISGYNVTKVSSHTDEWVLTVQDDIVTSCSTNGGDKGWQLYSVSRWTRDDAKKLKEYITIEFEINKRRDIYWDEIPMSIHFNDFKLGISVMDKDDIIEIDSIEELKKMDSKYNNV